MEAPSHWRFGGVYTVGKRNSDDRDISVARGFSAGCARRSEVGRPLSRSEQLWAFTAMTTSRPEIGVEGSNDRRTWKAYKFKWKPDELNQAPRWVAPHQPRLDWQMWFAALRGNCQNAPWFVNFMIRLLQGSPDVIELLETNPFPDTPPRYVRAVLYDYRFTDLETKREKGTWWKRERKGCIAARLHYARTKSNTNRIRAIRFVAEQFILVGWALPTISSALSRLIVKKLLSKDVRR